MEEGNEAKAAVVAWVRANLCPQVGVLSSDDAESVCQRNGLTFCDLLLPFAQLSNQTQIKDPLNPAAHVAIERLRVEFRDLRRDGFLASPQITLAFLSQRLLPSPAEQATLRIGKSAEGNVEVDWFQRFRSGLVRWLPSGDHEFLRHYLACLLVVSTAHPEPLDELQRLIQTQHAIQHTPGSGGVSTPAYVEDPRWFVPNIFKFHLLLHDPAYADEQKAESVYQSMKMSYGAHAVHLLRINSGFSEAEEADVWKPHLENKYAGLAAGLDIVKQEVRIK